MPQPDRALAGGRRVADGLDQVRFNRHSRTLGARQFPLLRELPNLKSRLGTELKTGGVLLVRKSDLVTTHYSAPEIGTLIAAAERVCELGARKSHALSLARAQQGV